MQQNTLKRINDIVAEDIRTRIGGGDVTLNALLGLPDNANGALYDLLGAFTNAESLKAILGDLSSTHRLGQTLGDLTETKNLGGILGGFSAAENLKAILGGYTAAIPLKTDVDIIVADTPYIHDQAISTPTTDSVADIVDRVLKALDMSVRPTVELCETWQNETGIDVNLWTVTDPATGTVWSRGASGAYLRAMSAPNADEDARLVSDQRWVAAPDIYGTNTTLRKLVLEFELKLTDVANLDETRTFLGLTTGAGDYRSTDNIIGWGINTDVLESITDDGISETTNTTFGETLTNWNKLKIEVYSGHVKFYINEVMKADHTTNLPDFPMYINFHVDTVAGGAATIELGVVRAWTEDIAR